MFELQVAIAVLALTALLAFARRALCVQTAGHDPMNQALVDEIPTSTRSVDLNDSIDDE